MPHKIFLSHNHNDKPVVEGVAVRLAEIFGQDQVFYDSWSIQPGDGIIDQMNKGLEAPEFVFFFVSANSLNSGMVKLEWQNAIYSATQGQTRIIPVRVDGTAMPPVLMQTLYIDLHTIGLEAAIAQIVSVTQGNASFTPQHQGFSNLTYSTTTDANGTIDIVVKASHLMEPNPHFMMLVGNKEAEIDCSLSGGGISMGGFNSDIKLDDGSLHNGITIRPMAGVLTPAFPVGMQLKQKGTTKIELIGVMHEVSKHNWVSLPVAQ